MTRRAARGHMPTFHRTVDWQASVARDQDRPRARPTGRSVILTWRCPTCREWTPEGSAAAGCCTRCWLPRPVVGSA